MSCRLHVIGAGIAGLSAAFEAAQNGVEAILYEAAPQAGGRCRTVRHSDGFEHDNGAHVILAANRSAFRLIDAAGMRARWIEPEPDGLPIFDLESGAMRRVGLSPWSWIHAGRRPAGLGLVDLPRLARLAWPGTDRPVADIVGDRPILRSLIEPMTVAMLNTSPTMASSRRLGAVLRRILPPGAARLFVAERGLGPDLIEPAIEALKKRGVPTSLGARLTEIVCEGRGVSALVFRGGRVALGPEDRVVLALPPAEAGRLLPSLAAPDAFEPIVNLHYSWPRFGKVCFLGLIGGVAQWALVRPGQISVTVSAAETILNEDVESLGRRVWDELRRLLKAHGGSESEGEPPAMRLVKERRATIRQAAGVARPVWGEPLDNLALAGDWVDGRLPATIEAAAESGFAAARRMIRGRGR